MLLFSRLPADYEVLLQQLQSNEASSGDSFYVRVNMSLAAGSSGSLAVFCNDVLHVTNTQPPGTEDSWHASQMHPCQLLDLQSGTVPNYYRFVHWSVASISKEPSAFKCSICYDLTSWSLKRRLVACDKVVFQQPEYVAEPVTTPVTRDGKMCSVLLLKCSSSSTGESTSHNMDRSNHLKVLFLAAGHRDF